MSGENCCKKNPDLKNELNSCENDCKSTGFLWDLFGEKEKTFTLKEVNVLVEKIKKFNAGAIDEYLDNHVNEAIKEWVDTYSE